MCTLDGRWRNRVAGRSDALLDRVNDAAHCRERCAPGLPVHGALDGSHSPARRVPSHGTHLLGTTYAIDFIGVDESGRSAPWGWRAALSTETPERFVGYGRPILAPIPGTVVVAHDGEVDHVARRSLPAGLRYLMTQAQRFRAGPAAIAGNHVVIGASADGGPYVLLAHLRRGSLAVGIGDRVGVHDLVGRCGNSGNSYQPHVHVQATDSVEWATTRGLPIRFRAPDGSERLPQESEVFVV